MYIAACQERTFLGDKLLISTEITCHFGHLLQVSKKFLSSLILYNCFHYFIHAYSLGTGADNPLGMKFWSQRNIFSLRSFVANLKKISLKSEFIHLFFMILYMYIAPGQGQTAPRGQSLISTEMSCHFIHLSQVSKNVFEVWFYTLFSWFNTCI